MIYKHISFQEAAGKKFCKTITSSCEPIVIFLFDDCTFCAIEGVADCYGGELEGIIMHEMTSFDPIEFGTYLLVENELMDKAEEAELHMATYNALKAEFEGV